jgi:glycosyltransferase involved in cell wall biosynthesis
VPQTPGSEQAPPRVSVLVPCAPRAPYLAETLGSLRQQTFEDWELVLVLDGECPENRRVAESALGDRVRFATTPRERSGPAVARHLGLEHCRGELLAFCDADDLCAPERLARQVARFDERPSLGLLATWARRFASETGADLGALHCPTEPERLARRLLLFNPVTNSTVMVRTRTARELGGFNAGAVRVEDYDLWLRFVGVAEVAALPEELVRYRVHDAHYSSGRIIGPQSAIIRRSRVAATRRLGGWSGTALLRHAAWLGVQAGRGHW